MTTEQLNVILANDDADMKSEDKGVIDLMINAYGERVFRRQIGFYLYADNDPDIEGASVYGLDAVLGEPDVYYSDESGGGVSLDTSTLLMSGELADFISASAEMLREIIRLRAAVKKSKS